MAIIIKGMEMPENCAGCFMRFSGCEQRIYQERRPKGCPLVEVPTPHGRLIDADALRTGMYHEAFETDSELQRWDSGCWVRYKMFENHMDNAPTIIEAEGNE